MPLCRRIQVTSLLKISDVALCRSSSERWAVVTIAHRGRPSGAHSIDWMSMGSPVIQFAKLGAASTALSFMANACRSFGGKNSSSSNTPSLRMGGCCTRASRVGRSMFSPAAQAVAMMLLSRMCSRLESGSAAIPTTDSRLVT